MARKHPRFLFSAPKNIKTPGPFIVHTVFPKGIFWVNGDGDIESIGWWDDATDDEQKSVIKELDKWLMAQVITGAIKL